MGRSQESSSWVADFVSHYLRDLENGATRPIREYLEMFPGDHDAIVTEYVARRMAASHKPLGAGDVVGPYCLEEELRSGAQGRVFRATHTRTGQRAAVKLLLHLGPGAELKLAYFRREAQIAAKLDHPGLCPLYDAEIDGGIPYIAMRYVAGTPFDVLIERSRAPSSKATTSTLTVLRSETTCSSSTRGSTTHTVEPHNRSSALHDILRFIEKVALAVHAAHEVGVVHRDLKPSNIMVTPTLEPVVLDFGLSREIDSETGSLTMSGDLRGTPAYMSPEQLTRNSIVVDRRTDVWSLGVILYEATTLRRPFRAVTHEALYSQILTKEPPRPRALNRFLPRDLQTVVLTALEKDRERRYQTAADFAEDLRRIRNSEPIAAVPAGPILRTTRWAQRNRALAVALATVALTIFLAFAVVIRLQQDTAAAWEAEKQRHAETMTLKGQYEQLLDHSLLSQLEATVADLWPATPGTARKIEEWTSNAERIAAKRSDYVRNRDALLRSAAVARPSHRATLDILQRIVTGIDAIEPRLAEARVQLDAARSMAERTIADYAGTWERIADDLDSRGLLTGDHRLLPQLGLIPLGRDPDSRHYEFAVYHSGEPPRRGEDDRLQVDEDSAIVLVLLTGGEFVMGSHDTSVGDPVIERQASIHLAPFFIGKYEVSQAQWLRVMHSNPAIGKPENNLIGIETTLLHPVEGVTWNACMEFARRMALQLPTEAQWEYACRASTSMAYAFGREPACLEQARVNLADAALAALYDREIPGMVGWDDGFPMHGPVSVQDINGYGVVGMLGNVSEWCLDPWLAARTPIRKRGNGLAEAHDTRRVFRGGNWQFGHLCCRSAWRAPHPPESVVGCRGLRVARAVHSESAP